MDTRRALIVDDSKLVCFKLGKMLEEKGISSHAVNSGEEALTYLKANPIPDVVFVDIMMPGMDGYQTVEAIRGQPALVQLPVIMCSSNDTDEDRAQAKRRGANGFLPKPPSPDHLAQILSSLSSISLESAAATPVSTPAPTSSGDNITPEVVSRLTQEAIEAAERAVNTRLEDLTQRLGLEVEETARRVAGTLAIETSRSVAQRAATETATQIATQIAAQTVTENLQKVAAQSAGEVARTMITELVPNLVLERMRAVATTTMPTIAEQTIQEATERLVPMILREMAATASETALRTALPKVETELAARLRENLHTDLARETTEKVARAVSVLLESDSFRQSMTRSVRTVSENIADQMARSVAETTARTIVEQTLAQAVNKLSPGEQNALEALRRVEILTLQLRRVTWALGAGLTVVVLYLLARLFI